MQGVKLVIAIIFLCLTPSLLAVTSCGYATSQASSGAPSITSIISHALPSNASPTSGSPVSDVNISVRVANFNLVNKIGATKATGEGHLIYSLDATPSTGAGQTATSISSNFIESFSDTNLWRNVSVGLHTFSVQLVNNDNTPLSPPVIASVIYRVPQLNPVQANVSVISSISALVRANGSLSPLSPSHLSNGPDTGFEVTINIQTSGGLIIADDLNRTDILETLTQGRRPPKAKYYLDEIPATLPSQPGITVPGISTVAASTIYTWHSVQPGLHSFSAELVNYDGTPMNPPQVSEVIINVESGIAPSPYSTSTPLSSSPFSSPPNYQLSPIGEWQCLFGSFGPGIIGKINNKDYLFTALNNANSISNLSGIIILDKQKPDNPARIAYFGYSSISALALSGTKLLVSTSDYLGIIDVSNPATPKELSRLTSVKPVNVAIMGQYAYVNDKGEKITIVDISDPVHPTIAGSLTLQPQAPIQTIKIFGNLLFALPQVNYNSVPPPPNIINGMYIVDISSPRSPRQISYSPNPAASPTVIVPGAIPPPSYPVPPHYLDIAVVDKYAYLPSGGPDGLLVLDISNPTSPKEINHVPEIQTNRILVSGHLLYFGIGMSAFGIADISNPAKPSMISRIAAFPRDYSDFAAEDSFLYFLVNFVNPAIEVVDASEYLK